MDCKVKAILIIQELHACSLLFNNINFIQFSIIFNFIEMSYFRNFGNAVSSQLFKNPNNLLFRSNTLPKILCQQNQPSIQHLHTSKYLINTISYLKQLQLSSNQQYTKLIHQQLDYLQKAKTQYKVFAKKYIENQGNLTAQSIANIYATAHQMGYSAQWLFTYIHNQIPAKARFMSLANLNDTIQGLKKYHPNSPYIGQLQKRKEQKPFKQFDYAERYSQEVTRFQYCGNSSSSNYLISSLLSGRSSQLYWLGKQGCMVWDAILQFLGKPVGYRLHDE